MSLRFTILLALAIAGIVLAGCGGDDSGDTRPSVSIPAVTAPTVSTSTEPAATVTPGTTSTIGKSYNPTAPDSETNDVPPPAGSPQEAFEKQCEQNPSACG